MRTDPSTAPTAAPTVPHVPVEVTGSVVRAGAATRRFRPGDARSLLTSYLALVRGLRDQRRARSIELRRADIDALAAYLGVPGSVVVERLAELMGATRSQRAAMLTLFGTGALVIGLAGSTAAVRAEHTPAGRVGGLGAPRSIPVGSPLVPSGAVTTVVTGAPATSTTAPTSTEAPTTDAPAHEPPVDHMVPPTILDAPPPIADAPPAPASAGSPVPTSATVPGSTVPGSTVVTDIGDPPVPPTSEVPGSTVVTDIGDPPVPPTSEVPATDPPVSSAPADEATASGEGGTSTPPADDPPALDPDTTAGG